MDGAVWADGEPFPSDIGMPRTSVTGAQSADGEPFPDEIVASKSADRLVGESVDEPGVDDVGRIR